MSTEEEAQAQFIEDKTEQQDGRLLLIVISLQARLGRMPTEQEVIDFIFGDDDTRSNIWNKETDK